MQFPLTFHTSPVAQAGSTLEISLLLSVCGTVLKEEPFFSRDCIQDGSRWEVALNLFFFFFNTWGRQIFAILDHSMQLRPGFLVWVQF